MARLGTAPAKVALQCQGVDANQILGAADVLAMEKALSVVPGPGQRKKPLHSTDHAAQLIGQVLWEEALIVGLQHRYEPERLEPDFHPGAGKLRRRPATARDTTRLISAAEVRCIAHEDMLDSGRKICEDRAKALDTAKRHRERQLDDVQRKLHHRHSLQEEQAAAFKQEQGRQLTQYARDLTAFRRERDDAQASRLAAQGRAFDRVRAVEAAQHAGRTWETKMAVLQRDEERVQGLVERTAKRLEGAEERRQANLQAKGTGPPQLQTFRELAAWQLDRVARLKEQERMVLQECLDQPPVFLPDGAIL